MRAREVPHGAEAGVRVDLRVRAGVGANLREKKEARAKRRNVQDLGIDQVKSSTENSLALFLNKSLY